MMNQKEAVFSAVKEVVGSEFKEGMNCTEFFKARPTLKEALIASLDKSLSEGKWGIKSDDAKKKIRSYIVGVVANYFRRDLRLNGGVEYVPENPGSKTGVRSKEIKAMKALLNTLREGSDEHKRVSAGIETEIEKIKAERSKADINIEDLPEEFRKFVK